MGRTATDATLSIGDVVAESYEITELIGRGGMGAVWRARHLRLPDKDVAIKVLLDRGADPEALARFRREAEIASRLGHPNIVSVLDFNSFDDGTPYIVMEYLEGQNLARHMRAGPMSFEDVLPILRQLGSALSAAHREGIVHRDLKPHNVMLCGGQVKVVDFGISKIQGSTTVKTDTARMLGTPQYMAPEQATGDHHLVDERADVFALGTIIYEMLTGEPLYAGSTVHEVVFKVVYSVPPELSMYAQLDIDPAVSLAVARAMEKQPKDRFASVDALVAAVCGEPIGQHEPPNDRAASTRGPELDTPSGFATRLERPPRKDTEPVRAGAGARGILAAVVAAVVLAVGALIAAQWVESPTDVSGAPATSPDLEQQVAAARAAGAKALNAGDLVTAAPQLAVAYRHGRDVATATLMRLSMRAADAYLGPALDGRTDVKWAAFITPRNELVSAHDDGTVRRWDGATGEQISTWSRPGKSTHVAISPDGNYVVARYDDKSLTVWEIDSGKITLEIRDSPTRRVSFVADSESLVTFAPGGRFTVYRARTGEKLRELAHTGDGDKVLMRISPQLTHAVTVGEARLAVWDLHTGDELEAGLPPGAAVTEAVVRVVRAGFAEVYLARADGSVGLFSMPDGAVFQVADIRTRIEWLAENRQADSFVLFSRDRAFMIRNGDPSTVNEYPRQIVTGGLFGPRARLIMSSPQGIVTVVGGDLQRVAGTFKVADSAPHRITFNEATGRLVAVTDGRASQWGVTGNLESIEVFGPDEGKVSRFALSPGGDRAVVWSRKDGTKTRLLDLESGRLLREFGGPSGTNDRAKFDPSGRYVASIDGVWDARTGRALCRLPAPPEGVRRVLGDAGDDAYAVIATSGRAFAVKYEDCVVTLEATPRAIRETFSVPAASGVLTNNGLTVAYIDKKLVTWDAAGSQVAQATAEQSSVFGLTRIGDGNLIVGRAARSLSVWDSRTLKRISSFGPTRAFFRLVGDDRILGWINSSVYMWRLPDGELVRETPHDTRVLEDPVRVDRTDGRTKVTRSRQIVGMILAADVSPDGRMVTITNSGVAYLWGPDDELLYTLDLPESASDVRFFPDGDTVAIAVGSNLALWDVAEETRPPDEIDRILRERGLVAP